MKTTIKVEMKPVNTVLARLGVKPGGDVQAFLTNTINKRMTAYMPFRTGYLATKAKFVKSKTEIEVLAPYARVMYYGKKMVNAATGKGPALIPGVGYRYRRGTVLKVTDQKMDFDTTKNPKAGPLWDRHMMAAEGKAIAQEVEEYARGR